MNTKTSQSNLINISTNNSLEDLYIRPELSQTKSDDQFVRWVQGFPYFMLIYASNYQMNLLKSVTHEDQIYIDGTFEVCPSGCEQMITIHIKKKAHDKPIPSMFIFLNQKDVKSYWYMWWVISTLLIPELKAVNKLFIACDFDMEMHKALKSHFKGVEIVGCFFHLIQEIYKWIKQNLPKDNNFERDPNLKKEIRDELHKLSKYSNENSLEQRKFLSKWRTLGGKLFYDYLFKTWFDANALFPPQTWTMACSFDSLDQANNQVEMFHHHLNRQFAERPELKRSIQILQEVEQDCIINVDRSFESKCLTSSLEKGSQVLSKKRSLSTFNQTSNENSKRQKQENSTQTLNNTTRPSQDNNLSLTTCRVPNPVSTPIQTNTILSLPSQNIPSFNLNPSTSNTQFVFESCTPNEPRKKRGRKPKSAPQPPTSSYSIPPPIIIQQIYQVNNPFPPFINQQPFQMYPPPYNNCWQQPFINSVPYPVNNNQ